MYELDPSTSFPYRAQAELELLRLVFEPFWAQKFSLIYALS